MTLAQGNPMTKVLLSVVVFEIVVLWLGFAGMVQVSAVPLGAALMATGAASALALGSAMTLRSPTGFYLGWAAQVAAIALGALNGWMYLMGGIFALIWVGTFLLGKRLEADSG